MPFSTCCSKGIFAAAPNSVSLPIFIKSVCKDRRIVSVNFSLKVVLLEISNRTPGILVDLSDNSGVLCRVIHRDKLEVISEGR